MNNIIQQEPIDFDERTHSYLVNSQNVPSVTKIISHFEGNSFYKDTGAKERGTVAHKLLEEFDNDIDVSMFYGEEYQDHLTYYRQFLLDIRPTFTGKEVRLFNPIMLYCGTMDRAGYVGKKDFVADIKTGSAVPKWAGIQTAAYAMAYYKNPTEVVRYAIHINPVKRKTYRLHVYSDPADFVLWEKWCKQYHKDMEQFKR